MELVKITVGGAVEIPRTAGYIIAYDYYVTAATPTYYNILAAIELSRTLSQSYCM